MHPAPLTEESHPHPETPRPTKTEVRGGIAPRELTQSERATSSDEEAMLLGDTSADEQSKSDL